MEEDEEGKKQKKKNSEQFICCLILSPVFKVNIYIQWNTFDPRPYFPQGLLLPSLKCAQQQGFQPKRETTCPRVQSSNFIKLFFFLFIKDYLTHFQAVITSI